MAGFKFTNFNMLPFPYSTKLSMAFLIFSFLTMHFPIFITDSSMGTFVFPIHTCYRFNHHTPRFKYPAKVTQTRYGTNRYAAVLEIGRNNRIV